LERYRSFSPRLKYSYFEKNLGAVVNLRHLLLRASARFVMFLSDEDSLVEDGASRFLNALESLDANIGVVSSSIYDDEKRDFYYRPKLLHGRSLGLNGYLMASEPLPSYLSGLTLRRNSFDSTLISHCFDDLPQNVYPHLELIFGILDQGSRVAWIDLKTVVKGPEAKQGGDSHAHLSGDRDHSSVSNQNLNLNPLIYGPSARALQFLRRQSVLGALKTAGSFPLFKARLFSLQWYARAIVCSGNVVIISGGKSPVAIAVEAINQCQLSRESDSLWPSRMIALLDSPRPVRRLLMRFISLFNRCVARLSMVFIPVRL
jgi:hypothetical protein